MKYKIVKPWLDAETQELHATIGEIVEMDDRERAERLIRAGAFEEVDANSDKKEVGIKSEEAKLTEKVEIKPTKKK